MPKIQIFFKYLIFSYNSKTEHFSNRIMSHPFETQWDNSILVVIETEESDTSRVRPVGIHSWQTVRNKILNRDVRFRWKTWKLPFMATEAFNENYFCQYFVFFFFSKKKEQKYIIIFMLFFQSISMLYNYNIFIIICNYIAKNLNKS